MPLLEDLETLRTEAQAAFAAADKATLEAVRVDFLGNRGKLKATLGRMGEVPKEQKPIVGKRANEIGAEIQAFFDAAKARIDTASGTVSGEAQSSYESLKQERLTKLNLYKERTGDTGWGSRFPAPGSGKSLTSLDDIRKKFASLDPAMHTDAAASTIEVHVAARVMLRRDQSKKLIFLTVQDQGGTIQVALWNTLLDEKTLGDLRDTLDLWDIVGITGKLAFTQKGEPTLWATSARLLTKCILPPPDKHHGIHDKEIRYRQRYLDMISEPQSRQTFVLRAKAVAGLRRFLDDQGFLEMETPVLQTIPGGAAARPFETHLNALDMKMYLRIATEIPLKKLLVGGLEKVYELGRIFRNEGLSPKHNPEFTSVEIYQAYGDLRDMMALTENVISKLALDLTGSTTVTFRGRQIKLGAPWPRLDYCELLQKHSGVTYEDKEGLARKLKEKGLPFEGLSHVDLIDGVFSEFAEPHLSDACFIINQPIEMSPLCQAHPNNPKLADRFEAFASGMEIANAYTELNDPIEQRLRLCQQLRGIWLMMFKELDEQKISLSGETSTSASYLKKRIIEDQNWAPESDKDALSILALIRKNTPKWAKKTILEIYDKLEDPSNAVDHDFLCAMEHGMPPAGGLGIGIDRVVMLLAGQDSIRDVIPFPLMRPQAQHNAEKKEASAESSAKPEDKK